jgi:nucleoside-diphosphate-sugar epimerase
MEQMQSGHTTIALTGATGFVGTRLLDSLRGSTTGVRILARNPSAVDVSGLRASVIAGALDDTVALRQWAEGADAVIHIAGAIAAPDRTAFHDVNAVGTANVAAAAQAVGVRRFVHVSSMAAREPGLSDYAASKRAGEAALEEAAKAMSWIILRPPAVYGPGDRATLPLLAQLIRRQPLLPGAGDNRTSLIHVDDLARAALAMAMTDQLHGGIFELHDGRAGGYSWHQLAGIAAGLEGHEAQVRYLPRTILAIAARLLQFLSALTGKPAMLSPGKVRELYHPDWVARNNLLDEHSEWRPCVAAPEGFAATLQWYRQNGWLPAAKPAARNHQSAKES